MTEVTMTDILGRLTPGRHVVSLQGEGEPTMHPLFWVWAERLRKAGYIPYTITNGSRIDAEPANRLLPSLGISLDTVDEIEANRIGRLKLDCVLRNVDVLLKSLGPERLIIHTVDYGQPMNSLLEYLSSRGLTRHIIQPIQPKSDYAKNYEDHPGVKRLGKHATGPCRYLSRPLMRYFDVNGMELPCCFIKDTREFPGVDAMCQQMSRGDVPTVCDGCSEIPRAPMNRILFA
jgi:MoaA/NifB/PqqE/SkfB family radical SAM enzyme